MEFLLDLEPVSIRQLDRPIKYCHIQLQKSTAMVHGLCNNQVLPYPVTNKYSHGSWSLQYDFCGVKLSSTRPLCRSFLMSVHKLFDGNRSTAILLELYHCQGPLFSQVGCNFRSLQFRSFFPISNLPRHYQCHLYQLSYILLTVTYIGDA